MAVTRLMGPVGTAGPGECQCRDLKVRQRRGVQAQAGPSLQRGGAGPGAARGAGPGCGSGASYGSEYESGPATAGGQQLECSAS